MCESGKRQSSFLCPKGTIFNQKHRVCDWWYNVKCEDATEFYDLNLDLLLLDKGVSPTQTTSLNVPPPIDPLSDLGNSIDPGLLGGALPLELLAGSDAELDSLILDDLVLSNLLGNRRMDTGEDNSGLYADSTASPITKQLPSSVAAPVQPQPMRRRKRNRRKNHRRGHKKISGGGGGGGSLCQIIGICDSVPSATQEEPIKSQHSPQADVPFAASQIKPLFIEAPKESGARLGEKTAAEIAELYAQTEDEPMRPITLDDSQFAASSMTNTLNIIGLRPDVSNVTRFDEKAAINFSDGLLVDAPPEEYRMTFFNTDVSELKDFSNVPMSSINFEDYEERKSKMMNDDNDMESQSSNENLTKVDFAARQFQLEEHNLDREAKTWRPLTMDGEGNVKRSDVSATLDDSDWVPKLGPEVKIRET